MKAKFFIISAIMVATLALTTGSAYAQGNAKQQRFVVPFDFNVGNKVLHAGEYTVIAETQAVIVRRKDGKEMAIALPHSTYGKSQLGSESKLTFRRYGSEYFLSQIWLPDGIGRELRKQKRPATDIVENVGTVDVVASTK
jgi:hypothetical protein